MAAIAIIYHRSHEHQKTSEDALCLVSEEAKNNVIKTPEKVASIKKKLRQGKHTCLVIRMEHPKAYKIH